MKVGKFLKFFSLMIMFWLIVFSRVSGADYSDTTFLRISIHVFNDESGKGNFQSDSSSHSVFLMEIIEWLNHQLLNLDTLRPEMPSEYVKSTGLQVRCDSIFYHSDRHAWDCSEEIDSDYMRSNYVDNDSTLGFKQKYQTLPIFLGNNYNVVGGHNSLIGDKRFIAMRGIYTEFLTRSYQGAVRDCGRGLLHELGHSLGLSHNFSGGPHGDQCDECEDNGCPEEGSSNNIMDYWPSYGYALSACQIAVIEAHLKGDRGNISDIIWNDSCYSGNESHFIANGLELTIKDTVYLHGDLVVESGARLNIEGYLSFPEGRSLIIQPGAEVFVQGGTLGNLCGDLWTGIRLIVDSDQPNLLTKLLIHGGVVENAKTGIITNCPQLIDLYDVWFKNNSLALDISGGFGYNDFAVDSCNFEIYRKINHWEEGGIPCFFVKIKENVNAIFKNCNFTNYEGHRNFDDDDSGIGILLENANIELKACSFNNLFKGLYARADSSAYSLVVDSCHFNLCHCAIQIEDFPKAAVVSSVLSLNRLNTMPSIGIYAQNVSLLNVSKNIFYSDYGGEQLTGIITDHTNPGTHVVEDNLFSLIANGILTIAGSELPEWPESLILNSHEELYRMPLGTIWFGNIFKDVEKECLNIYPDGTGLISGTVENHDLLNISYSREYPLGGFGPFASHQDYYTFATSDNDFGNHSNDILFFILSDTSWHAGEESFLDSDTSYESISDLVNHFESGIILPVNEDPLTFAGLNALAQHLESYPWLAYSPFFKTYLLERMNDFPVWFWNEIEVAMAKSDTWKIKLHDLIISLALCQVDEIDPVVHYSKNVDSVSVIDAARKVVEIEVLPEFGKLNIGLISESLSELFNVVPNPNNGEFGISPGRGSSIKLNERILKYCIRNIQGQIIKEGNIMKTQDLMIDIRPIAAGSYLLEIWSGNEFLGIQKFIILTD